MTVFLTTDALPHLSFLPLKRRKQLKRHFQRYLRSLVDKPPHIFKLSFKSSIYLPKRSSCSWFGPIVDTFWCIYHSLDVKGKRNRRCYSGYSPQNAPCYTPRRFDRTLATTLASLGRGREFTFGPICPKSWPVCFPMPQNCQWETRKGTSYISLFRTGGRRVPYSSM